MERGPFWRAGLLPESPWEAHPVTIIANLGEPIGESRFKSLGYAPAVFAEIHRLCGKVRTARGSQADADETLKFYQEMTESAAQRVVEHWRRDVDYLAAIRQIDLRDNG